MKHYSLDTNVLLRWLLEDVKEQSEAATKLIAKAEIFDVSDIAISEVIFVLEKVVQTNRQAIVENVFKILNQRNFNCSRALIKPAIMLYAQRPKLSFADCYLTVQADHKNATPLYTFDKALLKSIPGLTRQP